MELQIKMANKKLLLPTLLTAAALAPGVAQAGMGDIYMELNNVQVEAQTKANKSRKGWQDKPVEGLFNPVEKVLNQLKILLLVQHLFMKKI